MIFFKEVWIKSGRLDSAYICGELSRLMKSQTLPFPSSIHICDFNVFAYIMIRENVPTINSYRTIYSVMVFYLQFHCTFSLLNYLSWRT
jgi:hypothetical protein